MNCRMISALTPLVFGFIANRLEAQADRSFDPLGLPRTKLLCHRLPRSPADTGISYATALRFEESNDFRDSRVMDAAYDSSGVPVYLSVLATRAGSGGEPFTQALVARFGSAGSASGLRVRTPANSDSAGAKANGSGPRSAAPALEPMSMAEASQARTLALWLWSHRCPREPDSPKQRQ
jgi:hypothetical protein